MAIQIECPVCGRKQAESNKRCRQCNENMVTARRSGRLSYYVQYRTPSGKQTREFAGYTVSDARDLEGKRRAEKREKPEVFDAHPWDKKTFSDLTEWFLGLRSVASKKYAHILRYNLNSFNAVLGHMPISKVRPVDLEDYQAIRSETGLSSSYIDQEVGAARNMVYKAHENDMIGDHAVKAFKRISKLSKRNDNARDRILTSDEYKDVMKHLPRHVKGVFLMAYFTGMRRQEILSLVWGKVDLKNRLVYLEASDTKDNEPRTIPLNKEVVAMLRETPKALHDNHVFLYRGKPIRDIRRALMTACKKAGVPYGRKVQGGFTFHDLRHTFNTNMRKAGVPESVIMKITGHSTREMFDRYNTVDDQDTLEAIDRFTEKLQNVTFLLPEQRANEKR